MNAQYLSFDEFVSALKSKRRILIYVFFPFILLGLLISFTTPKEWVVQTSMLPEDSGNNIGNQFGGLASLAGVDLNNAPDGVLSPVVYEEILNSTSLCLDLLRQEYHFVKINETITLYEYLMNHRDVSLIQSITGMLKRLRGGSNETVVPANDSALLRLSYQDETAIKELRSRINLNVDDNSGLVFLSVRMQDPLVTAQMSSYLMDYLKNYIVQFNIGSTQRELEFIQKNLTQKIKEYELSQQKLDDFLDNNITLSTEKAKSALRKLQLDRDLQYNIYSTLSNKKEEVKLKLEKESRVLHVLEPVKVPSQRSQPRRAFIVVIYSVLGIFFGFLILVILILNDKRKLQPQG